MSGMVFPQSPTPDALGHVPDQKPAAAREKSGDSEFDAVSRQEQQRADRQLASKRQARADRAEQLEARRAEEADRARQNAGSDSMPEPAKKPVDPEAGADVADATPDAPEEPQADAVEPPTTALANDVTVPLTDVEVDASAIFTFADLRALVAEGRGVMPDDGDAALAPSQGRQSGLLTNPSAMISPAGVAVGEGGGDAPGLPGQTAANLLAEGLTGAVASAGDKAAELISVRAAVPVELTAAGLQPQSSQKMADAALALRGYTTSIELPVGHAEWGDKLVGKLTWLTASNMTAAEIHLTPPDMGPLDVRVKVHQDQATVTIHSANPVVRDQLELHSHRLRDMLNEQGIALDHFEVADGRPQSGGQSGSQDDNAGEGGNPGTLAGDGASPEESGLTGGSLDLTWKGELDLYA